MLEKMKLQTLNIRQQRWYIYLMNYIYIIITLILYFAGKSDYFQKYKYY